MELTSQFSILNTPADLPERTARVTAPIDALKADLKGLDPAIEISCEEMAGETPRTSIFITPKGARIHEEQFGVHGDAEDVGNDVVVMEVYDKEAVLGHLRQGKGVILTEKTDPLKAFVAELRAVVAAITTTHTQLAGADWRVEATPYDGNERPKGAEGKYHSDAAELSGQTPVVHTQMTFGGNQVKLEMVLGRHPNVTGDKSRVLVGFTPLEGTVRVIADFELVRADSSTIQRKTPTGVPGVHYELMFFGG